MKNYLFSVILLIVLGACKKDSPQPEPEIEAIVGKWKLTAYEKMVNGTNSWVPTDRGPHYMVVRYDGLILDLNGCPNCAPRSYYVNGKLFEVNPKAEIKASLNCPLVDCIGCATWDMTQSENELIVTHCAPSKTRSKYIRE